MKESPMKRLKTLAILCVFGALANCAKADIVAAQELPNGRVIVNDPAAYIGSEQNHVKTPWMIVSPDAMKGFANDFATNAISVVSEDGTNFYAHIETIRVVDGSYEWDRTKVIHFTVDKNGIPSKTGEVISTEESDEPNNFKWMKNRKLIGVKDGYLYFAPIPGASTNTAYLLYNPQQNKTKSLLGNDFRTSYQNDSGFYIVRYISAKNILLTKQKTINDGVVNETKAYLNASEDTNMALTVTGDDFYVGAGENVGNVRIGNMNDHSFNATPIASNASRTYFWVIQQWRRSVCHHQGNECLL